MGQGKGTLSANEQLSRRALIRFAGAGAAGLALVACGSPAPQPTAAPQPTSPPKPTASSAGEKPAAPTDAAPKPAAQATQAPAKRQIAKVTIAQTAPGLSFAPIYVALQKKYFEDESIDVDWQQIQGNALVTTAVANGDAHFGAAGTDGPLVAIEKNVPVISVGVIAASLTFEFGASREFLQRKGVTPQSPLQDKINAMKGAKIGVATVAGAPTQYAKYMLKLGGLNPETDAEYLTVGQGAARIAALREGQVDLFVGATPDAVVAEEEGTGVVYITMADEIPFFVEYAHSIFEAKKDWLEANRDVAERTCRAVGRACNLLRNDLPAAKEALHAQLPTLSQAVLDKVMDRLKQTWAEDGRMTETMWKKAVEVFTYTGAIKTQLPTAEGTIWTNQYIVNVPKR